MTTTEHLARAVAKLAARREYWRRHALEIAAAVAVAIFLCRLGGLLR